MITFILYSNRVQMHMDKRMHQILTLLVKLDYGQTLLMMIKNQQMVNYIVSLIDIILWKEGHICKINTFSRKSPLAVDKM